MNQVLKLEEMGCFGLAVFAFAMQTDFPWWYFPVFLLAPDISMLGYLSGNTAGAAVYNFFHHKAVAVLVYVLGFYTGEWVLFAGIILFAHACMDRVFGYGLKYITGFKDTHLGEIGKK